MGRVIDEARQIRGPGPRHGRPRYGGAVALPRRHCRHGTYLEPGAVCHRDRRRSPGHPQGRRADGRGTHHPRALRDRCAGVHGGPLAAERKAAEARPASRRPHPRRLGPQPRDAGESHRPGKHAGHGPPAKPATRSQRLPPPASRWGSLQEPSAIPRRGTSTSAQDGASGPTG